MTLKQIVSLWAISSLYQDVDDEEDVYCYTITKKSYKKVKNGDAQLLVGHVEVQSKITMEHSDMMFAMLQFSGGDFQCSIKDYTDEYDNIEKDLIRTFITYPLTEIIRAIDN